MVIPACNDQETIVSAVESALSQEALDEVVVVDDGSTDGTAELIAAIGGPVRYQSQRNAGPGAARNTGAAMTLATHLVFLHADDRLLHGAIERFADAHREGALLVRAPSLLRYPDDTTRLVRPRQSVHPFPRGTPLAGSFRVDADLCGGPVGDVMRFAMRCQ